MNLIARYVFVLFFITVHIFNNTAQVKPIANFSFDNKKDLDDINNKKALLRGASYTYDRFGNENSAVHLFGNQYSYINLGNYKHLKPVSGSISLWVKVENEVHAGYGYKFNPILITKCDTTGDFFEAYSLYYLLESKKMNCTLTKDSTQQIGISTLSSFSHLSWTHLLITYDNSWMSFYINGALEKKVLKNFKTRFLQADSVLIGSTGSIRNQRYLMATVDDISFYDKVLTPQEVTELYNAPNPNKKTIVLNWILIFLCCASLILLISFLIKYRVKKGVLKEKEKLELHNKLLETELRVNRASMNPHFLFNSLNALHNLILNNEIDNASDYLVKFSKLIRKILDSNMYESISLEIEIELLHLYLEIENLRFEENIQYTIIIDDSLKPSFVYIPIMMLQPFIENAIWHGLLNKSGEKIINITFSKQGEKYLYCIIEDNGIGRKKTGFDLSEKKSLATGFIMQRLELLNKINNFNCSLLINDKPDNAGTVVKIILPILNK